MSRTYALPKETNARIDGLVDEIERSPFGAPTTLDLEGAYERLNIKAVIDDLPEGLDEEDLRGILMLAMLTECATDSYADVFYEGARDYGAPWLGRFTERTWVPDEYTHADPFKSMLMSMGHSEAELDDHMKRVQEKTFVHSSGKTPVELTTFGMIQEFLTDHWHGMIAGLLQRKAPEAAHLANEIKKRETLHYMWYREMTAMQVQANPDLLHYVAETVTSFSMPGMSLVPEYQGRAMEWMTPAGADMQRNAREIIRHLYEIGGNTKRAGELLIDIAVIKGSNSEPSSRRSTNGATSARSCPRACSRACRPRGPRRSSTAWVVRAIHSWAKQSSSASAFPCRTELDSATTTS